MNSPQTIQYSFVGGDWEDISDLLPNKLRRLEIKSYGQTDAIYVKYAEGDAGWEIQTTVSDDTGWLPNIWENVKVWLKGAGVANIRVWV